MRRDPADSVPVERVALWTPGWPTLANGIATYAMTMQEAFRKSGVRALLVARSVDGVPPPDVVSAAPGSRPHSLAERLAVRLLGRVGPDRALAYELTRSILNVLVRLHREERIQIFEMEESAGWAAPIARRGPVPVVVRLHGPWFLNGVARGVPLDAAFRRRDRIEGESLLKVHGLTAPSRDVLRRTREHFELPLADAVVIPNPVVVAPAEACWNAERSDAESIAFIGRFDRHKGGDTVIDAFARVLEKRPQARLLFVGPDRGLSDDRGRAWQIDGYACERLGARRDRMEWVGEQPMEAIPGFRRAAAVTVVASRYETFAYAALEAMAIGSPLVSTDAGGLQEVVEDGRNGLTCRTEDAGALAAQLLRLLDDRALAVRLARQARADCLERYAPDAIARTTLDFYQYVRDRTSASRR